MSGLKLFAVGLLTLSPIFWLAACGRGPASSPSTTITSTSGNGSGTTDNDNDNGGSSSQAAPTVTLTATPTSVTTNQSPTLTWTSTNATTVSLSNGIGTVATSGSVTPPPQPEGTTTYTITATGAGGTATATATVKVTLGGSLTYKFDVSRSGLNLTETTLTPANVNKATFGKKGAWTLDGKIYTQPLYAANLQIGGATKNVLYVATEHASVYALDADNPGSAPLWQTSLLGTGEVPADGNFPGRTGIGAEVGITGTPVIDPNNNTLYVSAMSMTPDGANTYHRLHALDITTGQDEMTPLLLTASVPGTGTGNDGNGNVPFHAPTQNQRASLLLENGVIYVAFAAFSDVQPYHGWLFAVNESNLTLIDVFNTTPNTSGGGMWGGGSGPAADAEGNIYMGTANGFTSNGIDRDDIGDLSNAVLKMGIVGGKITVLDQFVPFDQLCLNDDDLDVASTGPLLLPDQTTGLYPHLMIVGSKESRIYLLNRDDLGGYHAGADTQIPQSILLNPTACGTTGFDAAGSMRLYGSPGYWNNNIYWGTVYGPLTQFTLNNGMLTQRSQSAFVFPGGGDGSLGRGPIPVVSANGTTNAIVWAANMNFTTTDETLYAFDATNLANQLYTSDDAGTRDAIGVGTVFEVPLVINGKVYLGSDTQLVVFGLL